MKAIDVIEWVLIILYFPFYMIFGMWNLFLDTFKTFVMLLLTLALIYNLAFPLFNPAHCTMSNEQYSLLMNQTVIEIKNGVNTSATWGMCKIMYGTLQIPNNKINITDLNRVCGGV